MYHYSKRKYLNTKTRETRYLQNRPAHWTIPTLIKWFMNEMTVYYHDLTFMVTIQTIPFESLFENHSIKQKFPWSTQMNRNHSWRRDWACPSGLRTGLRKASLMFQSGPFPLPRTRMKHCGKSRKQSETACIWKQSLLQNWNFKSSFKLLCVLWPHL